MIKKFVAVSALALALASPVGAQELIVNGDFENGSLDGWEKRVEYPYAANDFAVIQEGDGLSAYTSWNYQIQQDIEPTPVVDIQKLSLSAKTAVFARLAVIFYYQTDSRSPDYCINVIEADENWRQYDLISLLDPSKTLISIKISGYETDGPTGTWFDDVSVNTYDAVASTEAVATTAYDQGYFEGFYQGQLTCEVQEPEIREVMVEVPVEVVKEVRVEVPVEVVKYEAVSVCETIDYTSLSKKDARQAKKWCKMVDKWETRITKLINTGEDNNGKRLVAKK